MKYNPKRLKRQADIGDKLDLVPLIIILISLFGIGIFYAVFRAGFTLSFFALALFSVTLVISLLLYGIGQLNTWLAERTVFNYMYETVFGVCEEICKKTDADIKLNLSIKKEGIIYTLSDGTAEASCDLSPAKRLPTAGTLFIILCLGIIADITESNIADGKIYNNVVYQVIINDSPSPEQYFVKNGEKNTDETDRAKRVYKTNYKKYKRKKTKNKAN